MTVPASTSPRPGLTGLSEIALAPPREAAWRPVTARAGGGATYRARLGIEAHDTFGLEQLAERMEIVRLDLGDRFRALLRLAVEVPCLPPPGEELVVAHEALIALQWPEEILRHPLPGTAFVQILEPRHVWLPAVSFDALQVLCLGTELPVGTPVRELILAAYAALSMQSIVIDERDRAGVLNADAARWWQGHTDRIPLSREPFLAPRATNHTQGERDEEKQGEPGADDDG